MSRISMDSEPSQNRTNASDIGRCGSKIDVGGRLRGPKPSFVLVDVAVCTGHKGHEEPCTAVATD